MVSMNACLIAVVQDSSHPDAYLILALVVALSLLVAILLYVFARSGWDLRNLKRLKIGPVEAEKSDKETSARQTAPEGGIAVGETKVTIRESEFRQGTGDIGGVIIKDAKAEAPPQNRDAHSSNT